MGSRKTFLGHPIGLSILFLTEMWERFSFYGMQAIFVYYMIYHLHFKQEEASKIFGLYIGFAYFTPFFGGILADKFFGQKKMVIFGGILMAFGHFLMAFESLLYPALVLLVLGNGALKPNISTQVSGLYTPNDNRIDRAFSIFYLGINIGAFLSPLICGTLGEKMGYHYGFAAAGFGMIISLATYILGQKYLCMENLEVKNKVSNNLNVKEKKRILIIIILGIFNIFFWAIYEQQGNTLALWAEAHTNRNIFGFTVPASWFQSINPLIMFVMTPLLCLLWSKQNKIGREPSNISKMAIGCFLLGFGFLPLIIAAKYSLYNSPMWYLLMCLFFMTVGELYLSPIGLSFVTKLAPKSMVSMLMGAWFLSSFAGNYLSGVIGSYWEKIPKETFFLFCLITSIFSAIMILILKKPMKTAIAT